MAITFDPAKNERTIAERGLPFERLADLEWDTAVMREDDRRDYGETRLRVLALLHGRLHAVVVSPRGGICVLSASGRQTEKRNDCMTAKKPNPERGDDDNPEWTRDDMASARPASGVLPGLIGQKATDELMRRGRGRPHKDDKKISTTVRLDPDVLEAFQMEGKGWQTRINEVLRQNMPRHRK